MPVLPSWLTDPRWIQFEALPPERPDEVTVHLDAGYDSGKTRTTLGERGLHGKIAHKGEKADTIITVRSLIRRAWVTHRWENRPNRRP